MNILGINLRQNKLRWSTYNAALLLQALQRQIIDFIFRWWTLQGSRCLMMMIWIGRWWKWARMTELTMAIFIRHWEILHLVHERRRITTTTILGTWTQVNANTSIAVVVRFRYTENRHTMSNINYLKNIEVDQTQSWSRVRMIPFLHQKLFFHL